MAIYARASEDRVYEDPKPGSCKGYIGAVWDVGMQKGFKDKPPSHRVCLAVELDQRRTDGKRFVMYPSYSLNLAPKAPLRATLSALFPGESLEQFDVERMKGLHVYATVGRGEDGGKIKITAMVLLPEEMRAINPETDFSQPTGLAKWYLAQRLDKAGTEMAAAVKADSEVRDEYDASNPDPLPF